MLDMSKTVCIIDDDNIYVTLVRKIIEIKNFSQKTLVFRNGKEALLFFQEIKEDFPSSKLPDLVLLDINMPIMDGWQFLDGFNKLGPAIQKKLDLYVVSSSINPVDIARAKENSAVADYIPKPIAVDDLKRIFS